MNIKKEIEFKDIENLLNSFIEYCDNIDLINKKLTSRKIRKPNFPSEISENLVKYLINKNENKNCQWDIKKGDLIVDNKTIEVKAFSSNGPSSFGPSEKWDEIYFVDATKFKIYKINLSNSSEFWENIKINSKQTYKSQCEQKKRPGISFKNIKLQIFDYITELFDSTLNKLK